eukprot:SAG31_NODE_969_length_10677_cov_7.080072_11_plen_67_part_00
MKLKDNLSISRKRPRRFIRPGIPAISSQSDSLQQSADRQSRLNYLDPATKFSSSPAVFFKKKQIKK